MALDNGYIKLHRSITEWEWYKNETTKSLFLHLLLTVNIKDSKFEGYKIPRGSRICSYSKLAEETGLTKQQIRTAINHLKSTQELTLSKTPKFSIISIANWGRYQDYQHSNQHTTNTGATQEQHHNKNIKEDKRIPLDTLKRVSKGEEKGEKAVSKYADWNDKW